MATSAKITCCNCEEVYNLEERKPLLLPCSHIFCRNCLQQMKLRNEEFCPTCRSNWRGQPLDNLPFMRQLASDTSDEMLNTPKGKYVQKQNLCKFYEPDQLLSSKMS